MKTTQDSRFAASWGSSAVRPWLWLGEAWSRVWSSIETRRATQRRRTLRVIETVGLGEKRFVAIVQVEGARYLVGGGGISLVARLDAAPEFAALLEEQAQPAPSLAANRIREAW